jgi:hypothetical protein
MPGDSEPRCLMGRAHACGRKAAVETYQKMFGTHIGHVKIHNIHSEISLLGTWTLTLHRQLFK